MKKPNDHAEPTKSRTLKKTKKQNIIQAGCEQETNLIDYWPN